MVIVRVVLILSCPHARPVMPHPLICRRPFIYILLCHAQSCTCSVVAMPLLEAWKHFYFMSFLGFIRQRSYWHFSSCTILESFTGISSVRACVCFSSSWSFELFLSAHYMPRAYEQWIEFILLPEASDLEIPSHTVWMCIYIVIINWLPSQVLPFPFTCVYMYS